MRAVVPILLLVLSLGATALAVEGEPGGQVQIPLEHYTALVQANQPTRPAPSGYALGQAEVEVKVEEVDGRATAQVEVALRIDVLEDEWVFVPVLPPATPVTSVTVDGKPVQLIHAREGLGWGVNRSGSYAMQLRYRVDATRSGSGFVLTLPLPEAAATQLAASLPGAGLDVALIPAAGVELTAIPQGTRVTATVPATRGAQLSWRAPTKERHSVSRASYQGELRGDAIHWTALLDVEIRTDQEVSLELLPRHVTLGDVEVDGRKASILVSGRSFATLLRGRGPHRVKLRFQVPIRRGSGPPTVALPIPEVPVSSFELRLPGRKEISVAPAATVAHRVEGEATLASFHVPMTREVTLRWSEAIPAELVTATRAHASLFHAVRAEEGVLYVDALVLFEVSRGEVRRVELDLPAGVQVDRIESEDGGISDWRVAAAEGDEPRRVTLFLDHPLTGTLRLRVHYDRSLLALAAAEPFGVPLLRVREVQRQRGMVALLATDDVTLRPAEEARLTRVGENQLPAFFREGLEGTVAHTFKYVEAAPRLTVVTATPERVLAKFDAEVNTLVSLTDVTIRGAASVNVHVKSGKLSELTLALPADVNLLALTAPSLRTHQVRSEGGRQWVAIEFTQDLEGHFRIEVAYERITTDGEDQVSVPTLRVEGAEVEQGRIAVEALAAVEVQEASAAQLSSLDPSELPQQLVLKTTNPILLAYKYVHVEPPPLLGLRVTRHPEVEVQLAAIDRADYRTLFTRDGLAVTASRFWVRNSRKQFLRVRLPRGARVWSATVDGRPEKPATAVAEEGEEQSAAPEILIKVINSESGFPVEVVYATPAPKLGRVGRLYAHLPRPDLVVTQSHWDVYLPDAFRYGRPRTNMDSTVQAVPVSQARLEAEMARLEHTAGAPATRPIRIQVPHAGVHFAFEKVYANQSEDDAWFSLPYTSPLGAGLAQLLVLIGTALFWFGLAAGFRHELQVSRRDGLALAMLGLAVGTLPIAYLGTDATAALALSALALLGGLVFVAHQLLQRRGPAQPELPTP